MIQKETYSLENIKRIREKYNVDPELAQRAVFALGLVEALVKAGTQFVFKGGSSLMILFEVPKRLSTDVDILVEPNYDIETHIKKAAEIFPFISTRRYSFSYCHSIDFVLTKSSTTFTNSLLLSISSTVFCILQKE